MNKFVYSALLLIWTAAMPQAAAPRECMAANTLAFYVTEAAYEGAHPAESAPVVWFEVMEHDFGTLPVRSEPRTALFRFSNRGDAPLVITRTEQSCTCISVKYTRKPVMPGGEGTIEITYSPKKETGAFTNYVKIYSNAPEGSPAMLFVRGEVVK